MGCSPRLDRWRSGRFDGLIVVRIDDRSIHGHDALVGVPLDGGFPMQAVTVSPKFQVVIPQAVREQLGIEPGQKLQVITYEHRIEFLPI